MPLSVEVFPGNTADPATFRGQVRKVAERFGGGEVTFVGDRGMIKSSQVEDLAGHGFHYITAITKPQIETLLRQGVLQLGLFDATLAEVTSEAGPRYVLRRNPLRAEEIAAGRRDKFAERRAGSGKTKRLPGRAWPSQRNDRSTERRREDRTPAARLAEGRGRRPALVVGRGPRGIGRGIEARRLLLPEDGPPARAGDERNRPRAVQGFGQCGVGVPHVQDSPSGSAAGVRSARLRGRVAMRWWSCWPTRWLPNWPAAGRIST